MTYADLIAARTASAVIPAERRGTVLRHASSQTHIWVTQFELHWNRIALANGRLEHEYELKRVGRHEGGHIFRSGFKQQTWELTGWVNLPNGCGSSYAADAANLEMQLLKEFLRGNCDAPYADDYPDPRLELLTMTVPSQQVIDAAGMPFDGTPPQPLQLAQPFMPGTTETVLRKIGGIFAYVPDSFNPDRDHNRKDYYEFTFSLQELPVSAVLT